MRIALCGNNNDNVVGDDNDEHNDGNNYDDVIVFKTPVTNSGQSLMNCIEDQIIYFL